MILALRLLSGKIRRVILLKSTVKQKIERKKVLGLLIVEYQYGASDS